MCKFRQTLRNFVKLMRALSFDFAMAPLHKETAGGIEAAVGDDYAELRNQLSS
jgi:hypothetical protein